MPPPEEAGVAAEDWVLPSVPDIDKVIDIIRAVAVREIMPRFGNLAAHDIAEKRGPKDLVTVADTENAFAGSPAEDRAYTWPQSGDRPAGSPLA